MRITFLTPRLAGLSLAVILLSGCAQTTRPLYYWGNYQTQVYERLKGESSDAQKEIAALEETLQKARASGMYVPPGFHAHLGMLYAETGKADQVQQQLETEKDLFPESAVFMDFLLAKLKGGTKP
jgi:hypothetical protein